MELYFNMFKIRYLLMDELMKDVEFIPGEEINIFINIENVLKKITSTIEDKENMLSGPKRNLLLTSCIFNLVAHYRNYFNKMKVCSKVYVYGPESVDMEYLNRNYISDYRANVSLLNRDKLTSIGNTYTDSIKFIKTILEYVEGVYFVTSGVIEPSVIPLLVTNYLNTTNSKNIMISDDRYEFQYTKEDFTILKPRLEKSAIITKQNVMDVIKERTKCKNVDNPSINFIPFIISILGDSYRSIPKIKRKGVSTIYKEINTGVDKNLINDDVENIMSLLQIFETDVHNQVTLNYLSTNIYEQMKRVSTTELAYLKNQIKDKHDAGYLRYINDEFFLEFPLSIIEINRGVRRRKKKIEWR